MEEQALNLVFSKRLRKTLDSCSKVPRYFIVLSEKLYGFQTLSSCVQWVKTNERVQIRIWQTIYEDGIRSEEMEPYEDVFPNRGTEFLFDRGMKFLEFERHWINLSNEEISHALTITQTSSDFRYWTKDKLLLFFSTIENVIS